MKRFCETSEKTQFKILSYPYTCNKNLNINMVKQVNNESLNMSANIGKIIHCALDRAMYESRLVVGLAASAKELSTKGNGDAMFCLLATPEAGDSATHMHTILLEAFCFENDIYIIKLDSGKKLSRILGTSALETCVLIQRPWNDGDPKNEQYTADEEAMVNHCEAFWDVPQQPIIALPE